MWEAMDTYCHSLRTWSQAKDVERRWGMSALGRHLSYATVTFGPPGLPQPSVGSLGADTVSLASGLLWFRDPSC